MVNHVYRGNVQSQRECAAETVHENLKSPDLDSIASDTFLIHSGGKLRRAEAVESAIVVVPVRAVSSQHRPVFTF